MLAAWTVVMTVGVMALTLVALLVLSKAAWLVTWLVEKWVDY